MGTMRTNENIAQVAAVLKDSHLVSCRMTMESTGYQKTTVHRILSDDLKKGKLYARYVPHALIVEQREHHVVHAKDLTFPHTLLL